MWLSSKTRGQVRPCQGEHKKSAVCSECKISLFTKTNCNLKSQHGVLMATTTHKLTSPLHIRKKNTRWRRKGKAEQIGLPINDLLAVSGKKQPFCVLFTLAVCSGLLCFPHLSLRMHNLGTLIKIYQPQVIINKKREENSLNVGRKRKPHLTKTNQL